jgi:hypothetical protein
MQSNEMYHQMKAQTVIQGTGESVKLLYSLVIFIMMRNEKYVI